MRVLLDENLNWRLERALPGHHIESVQRNGLAGLKNGEWLARAVVEKFDGFITMDGNIAFQQNYANLPRRKIARRAASNRLRDTEPLMFKVLTLLPGLRPGTLTTVALDS